MGAYRVALVKRSEAVKLALRVGWVLVFTQDGGVKTTALHLHQLVNQHVAGGANFAFETETTTQQKCLTEGPAIAEFGEVQVNPVNVFKIQ